jgi:DNA-binding FadR family transcriptional regulator
MPSARREKASDTTNWIAPIREAGFHSAPIKNGEALARRIELEIIEMGWPVGELLGSEVALLERYGVSRAVLREAVRILEHHMVARMKGGPGGGLMITAPSASMVTAAVALYLDYRQTDPSHLLDSRAALELKCVELATARMTEEGILRLRSAVESEKHMTVGDAAFRAHDLHFVIAELAQDPPLEIFVGVLLELTREISRQRVAANVTSDSVGQSHQDHSQIVEAMIHGDAALARLRMLRHLEWVIGRTFPINEEP